MLLSFQVQSQIASSIRLLEFKYGYHRPFEDMKDRFGSSNDLSLSLQTVGLEKKLFWGIEGMFFFSNAVNEDVLAPLRSFDGNVIGIDGRPGDINLKERGYYIGIDVGKIYPTGKHEKKLTGVRVQIGGGMLQHKIRVQDNFNSIVALEKKYLHGYDRLTNGPAIHVGLGYQYQSPHDNLHFHIMSDFYGARTRARRDFDYAEGRYLDHQRIDILAGLALAYIVTISRVNRTENIYY
jgi:hypothetical protein